MATLLNDIEAFLVSQSISATAFGDEALGDRHFVKQLRGGRRTWPETEKKVRAFMAARTVCSTCERRGDDPVVASCTAVDCPIRAIEALSEAIAA